VGYLTVSTNVSRYQTQSHVASFSFRKITHWSTCIVCATQSNFCGALDVLSPEPCAQQPRAERIYYNIAGVIQQREYESSVKKTEEIKERLAEFWQCDSMTTRE